MLCYVCISLFVSLCILTTQVNADINMYHIEVYKRTGQYLYLLIIYVRTRRKPLAPIRVIEC